MKLANELNFSLCSILDCPVATNDFAIKIVKNCVHFIDCPFGVFEGKLSGHKTYRLGIGLPL